MTETRSEAEEFFYQHAGYSWLKDVETQEEGRKRCARELAEAEAWGKERSVSFSWEDDWDLGTTHADFYSDEAYPSGDPETCETCVAMLMHADGEESIASLGCVDDADANYRRVVEAELAAEIKDQLEREEAKVAEEQGYNGWKNYETWSVSLIIDNDQRTYTESREIARDAIENGEPSEYWTEEQRKRYRVAEALKSWVEETLETSTEPKESEPMSYLVSQLVRAALDDVDWNEIADNYIEELAGQNS